MRITQSWHRNMPTTGGGYALTITIVYSSKVKAEIDEIEKKMPEGMMVFDTDKSEWHKREMTVTEW